MAIYHSDARQGQCPVIGLTMDNQSPILDFTVDVATDVEQLPGSDKIRVGSTAFVINTSQVFMLSTNGWREI